MPYDSALNQSGLERNGGLIHIGPIRMEEMFHIEIISLLELGWESLPCRTRAATYLSVIQKKRNNTFEEKVRKLEVEQRSRIEGRYVTLRDEEQSW